MQTRVLTESDAEAYRRLRVRALGEEPLAFLRTPEEADTLEELPLSDNRGWVRRLHPRRLR